jgi:NAD(P)-dependent dehydrogenase (short-subunit alcohol dehydrogenase family)
MAKAKSGRVFLVTGGASGIGEAIVRLAIQQGDKVAIADINAKAAEGLATELGDDAFAVRLDVRSPDEWRAAVDAVYGHFGRLDILVNNAGIVHPGLMGDVPVSKHRDTFEVNLYGPMNGFLEVLPRFRQQGAGHVVTICSLSAFCVFPVIVTYGASKAGLRALHLGFAYEERSSPIDFTIVHPTATETPMLEYEAQQGVDATFALAAVQPQDVAAVTMKAIRDKKMEVSAPRADLRKAMAFGGKPEVLIKVFDESSRIGAENLAKRFGTAG